MPVLSRDDVAKLDDNKLRRWFEQNARWSKYMTGSNQYYIRYGMAISAKDTAELWTKFKQAVDEIRKEI